MLVTLVMTCLNLWVSAHKLLYAQNINRVGSFDIVGSYLVGKFSDRNSIWFYHCQYSFDDDPSFSKITQHISELKNSPAPDIAVMYYTGSDLYLFVIVPFTSRSISKWLSFVPQMNFKHPDLPILEGQ
ncbi:hypothetical protein YC2023_031733 [Brassica napus]